jgi:hypothetical protein
MPENPDVVLIIRCLPVHLAGTAEGLRQSSYRVSGTVVFNLMNAS